MDCALRTLTGVGYTPIRGGTNDGYILFERAFSRGLLGGDDYRDHITVTSAGGHLRVTVVGNNEKDKQVKPDSDTVGHAEAMLASCANPQSFNGSN